MQTMQDSISQKYTFQIVAVLYVALNLVVISVTPNLTKDFIGLYFLLKSTVSPD